MQFHLFVAFRNTQLKVEDQVFVLARLIFPIIVPLDPEKGIIRHCLDHIRFCSCTATRGAMVPGLGSYIFVNQSS